MGQQELDVKKLSEFRPELVKAVNTEFGVSIALCELNEKGEIQYQGGARKNDITIFIKAWIAGYITIIRKLM